MASTDRESSLYHCRGPVKHVQSCLCVENILQRRFNRREGAVKHVQACLSAIEDREITFYHCGSSVNLVQACVWAGNTLERHFSCRCEWSEARAGFFKYQ